MIHDLRLALRHLWRKKIYTVIILLSLTVGFTCTTLLTSFLVGEMNTDSFHPKGNKIVQLFSNDPFGGKDAISYIQHNFLRYISDTYPDVEEVCQIALVNQAVLQTEAAEFRDLKIISSDTSFFSLFDFPLHEGTSKDLTLSTIIFTRDKAKTLFGEENPIGKVITFKTPDTTRLLTVAAIFDKAPENSHLVFDGLIQHVKSDDPFRGGAGYALLHNSNDYKGLQQKINSDSLRPSLLGPGKVDYLLEPLSESYFSNANRASFFHSRSKLFIWVGFVTSGLILFIASFNFINLFLLSLQGRKKETGIKKTLGISFHRMVKAIFTEVILHTVLSFVASLALTTLLIPSFNNALETQLTFSYLSHLQVVAALAGVLVVLGLLVILISAIRQWNVKPIQLMANGISSRLQFNKLLFTVQFIIAITLAICSITVVKQMDFIENEPLGFNRDLLQLQSFEKEASAKFPALKQSLLQIPGIHRVTICSGNPISGNMITQYALPDGKSYSPYIFSGDDDFAKTLQFTLVEGEIPAEGKSGSLVNETLIKFFNMQHPIGEVIPGTDNKIIGVVKDFTLVSFKREIPPVIISYLPEAQAAIANNSRMLISFQGKNSIDLLPQIQREWTKNMPDSFFSYQILQQDLLRNYREERSFFKIVIAFALVSMLISCFGLFALSWAVVQSRTKEIGIRKVLGASVKDIVQILTLTFAKRIMIAFLIAAPLGYWLINQWLSRFVNRITVGANIFISAGVLVVLVALITLMIQTVKAAMSDPVKELRSE